MAFMSPKGLMESDGSGDEGWNELAEEFYVCCFRDQMMAILVLGFLSKYLN